MKYLTINWTEDETINNRSMPRGVKEVRRKWAVWHICELDDPILSNVLKFLLNWSIWSMESNGLPVKVSAGFLSFFLGRNLQTDFKTHKEIQWTWNSLTSPGKELKWTVTVSDFKTFYSNGERPLSAYR